jgi:membrane protease YdiL (CAAX protease family)
MNKTSILENCSIQELIKFDINKKTSTTPQIIFVAIACVILNNIIYILFMKYFSNKKLQETLKHEYKEDIEGNVSEKISPFIFGMSEIINTGLYAPIVEELFFRFFLLKILFIKILKMNIHTANILHSIIFGSMHLTNAIVADQHMNRTIVQSIMAGIGGLISGYAYMYTNSIATPLIAHIINNVLASTNEIIDYSKAYNQIIESFAI